MNSQFFDALQKLHSDFVAQLAERIDALHSRFRTLTPSTWQCDEVKTLLWLIQGLKDSVGTFGMPSLADTARDIELRLSAWIRSDRVPAESEWQIVAQAFDDLRRLFQELRQTDSTGLWVSAKSQHYNQSPLVALLGDDAEQTQHLQNVLQQNGFRIQVFSELSQLQTASIDCDTERPAVVLIDSALTAGDFSRLEAIANWHDGNDFKIPMVVISRGDGIVERLAALRAGASRYLSKPVSPDRMIDVLLELTGHRPPEPYRALLIEADSLTVKAHAAELLSAGIEVESSTRPLDVLKLLKNFLPDVLVLDVCMPEATGLELAAIIRDSDAYSQLPILLLSAESDRLESSSECHLNIDDLPVRWVSPRHLLASVTVLARSVRQDKALRQRLETTLYKREREHLAINHHAIVSIADRTGAIIYVNDKFCDISGYRREELLGQDHRIVKSGEHPPEFYRNLWRTIAGGQVWQGEICNRRKDGELYWVESTITPFLGNDGKPYQYVAIRTDISHVKKSLQRLKLLERAVEASSSAVSIADVTRPDMPLIFINKAFEHITGYRREEILGSNCRILSGEDRHQPELDKVRSALAEGRSVDVVLRNYRKDGTLFWNELRVAPVHDEQGVLTHFIGITTDVTERIRNQEAMKQSEEKLRATLESCQDGILAVDNAGSILFTNRQFVELWRIPEALALPGQPYKRLQEFIEPQLVDPLDYRKRVQQIYRSGQNSEDLLELADGRIFERRSKPLALANTPAGRVWSLHDITATKLAQKAVEYHKERLRRGQIFANIGTWEWTIKTGELYWSERIAPLFGYPNGDLETSYENFLNAVHPDDRQAVIDAIDACLQHDEPLYIKNIFKHKII